MTYILNHPLAYRLNTLNRYRRSFYGENGILGWTDPLGLYTASMFL